MVQQSVVDHVGEIYFVNHVVKKLPKNPIFDQKVMDHP